MSDRDKIEELEKRIEKLEKAIIWIIYKNANDKRGRISGIGESPF